MYKNRILPFLLVMLAILIFNSCSLSENRENNKSDSHNEKNISIENTDHLKSKLQDKLIIDADINYNAKIQKYNSYEAKLKIFEKENVRDALMPGKLVTDEFYKGAGEPISRKVATDYYLLENKEGASLGISGTMIYYEMPVFENIYYAFKLDKNSDSYNADKYKTEGNLSFMSRKESFKQIESVLNKLGIQVDENYTCYSLDSKTMTKEYHYVSVSDDDNENRSHIFEKEEESYCFVLHEKVNNLPIAEFSYGNSDSGTYVAGTEIEAYFGTEGLVMLSVRSPYETTKAKSEQTVMDLKTAINRLNEKYESIIISDEIEVTKISLDYLPILVNADKNEYVLTPAWVFQIKQKFSDHNEYHSVMFNAETGEEYI